MLNTVSQLTAVAQVGFYIPLYGFDVDATEEQSRMSPGTFQGFCASALVFLI